VAGLGAVALAVCAEAGWIEDRGDRTVIHVKAFYVPDPSDTAAFNRAEVAAVRAFHERFPAIFAEKYRARYEADPARYGRHDWKKVEISVEPFSGIRVEGVEVDLLAIAGGVAPDILYLNFRKSDTYIQNGFLYPLDRPEDGYLSAMSKEEVDFRIHPKLWPVLRRKGPEGREHVWALPWGGTLGTVLLYRKDLFDAKGIPYPTANWTWDDMMAAARALTDPRKGTYGLSLWRSKHESHLWLNYLWSAGGEMMVYDEPEDRWRCVFDSREAAVALDFYTRLSAEKWTDADGRIRRGYSTKDAGDAPLLWDRGQVGMHLWYMDEKVFSRINPELTGIAPVPLGPTGLRGSELNSRMMALFSQVRDPAVRDAAWEYMRFYDGEEAARIKTRVMVEGGLGPFVNPKYLARFGYPEIERLAQKGWAETFDIAIESSRPEPYGRNSNIGYEMMTPALEEAGHLALADRLPEDPEQRLDVLQDILRKANRRANEEMIGLVSPRERTVRRAAAALFLATLAAGFTVVVRRVLRAFTPQGVVPGVATKAWDFRRHAWAYVLLLPALLTVAVWQYVPLGQGTTMAFFDVRLIGKSVWVGLDNFGDALFNRYWWNALWNSLRYSLLVLSMTFLPPIILAIFLQEVPRGRLLYRLIFYLPAVVTGIVTVLLWKQFYEPSEQGALNAVVMRIPAAGFVAAGAALLAVACAFARRLWHNEMRLAAWGFLAAGVVLFLTVAGWALPILQHPGEAFPQVLAALPGRLFQRLAEPYRWLGSADTAMFSCVLPMVWAGVGPGCLIYLAALKGIADDYYEAADIDGATFIDKILFIILPLLKPLIVINFVGLFIASWYGGEGNILVMTGGASNTEVAGLHIWFKAFTFLRFGPATAMAWMLGFLLIGFTVQQLTMLARVEFRRADAGK
jgi:ABC-type sugar transport system permease subunit/ABC-type glycerol-3-phosphate transport system substrate-binding protein